MRSPRYANDRREAMTLLEVLVALVIFLSSLVAIAKLITMGGDAALDTQQQAQATQLCQAKLAEVVAGVVPLSGQSDVPFDEDPNWLWSVDAGQGDIAGLWKITVRVSRQRSDGSRIECSLDRMLLDPTLRGSTLDAAALAANSSSSSSSNSSNSGSSAATGSSSSSTSGGAKTTTGGAASGSSSSTPKSGAGTASPSSSGAKSSTPVPSSSGNKGTTKGGN